MGPVSDADCSIARSLSVVGEKWTLLVLREAFNGVHRFADFQSRLAVPRAVLTQRLNTLVDAGLMKRVPYRDPGDRIRQEYRLTRMGVELYPALVALLRWGDKWLADNPAAPPVRLEHAGCGRPVDVALVCDAAHVIDGAWQIRAVPTPDPAASSPHERSA
ncbi:MAG TPA: helix-turn-helix domain-containing protein [Streptosporangiaceae bacterium]|nr:helix-turn-helix domain-containing protein [Streptosporangiaceae bacterium]